MAEFERELIRESVRAGIKSAKHKGKKLGRKRVVFDRSRAEEMHKDGATVREIAIALQVGRGTVHVSWPKNLPDRAFCKTLKTDKSQRSD